MPVSEARSTEARPVLVDAFCLAAITLLSALPYLPFLGWYADDWGVLAGFEAVDSRSAPFFLEIVDFGGRPLQGLYLGLLYKLFGYDPLGGQIVNIAVIATCISLFYLLMVRLGIARAHALAVALIFVMLPQLSAVRVWFSAFQIPLSLAFSLFSLHAQLSYFSGLRWRWLAAAVVSAMLSIAAYEIFAPLMVGFAIALGVAAWKSGKARPGPSVWIAGIILLATVGAGVLFKILFSGRASTIGDPDRYLAGLYQLVRTDYDWRLESSLNIFAMLNAYFWAPVLGWVDGAATLVTGGSGFLVAAMALLIAGLAFWRLRSASDPDPAAPVSLKRLFLIGSAAFVVGHATFLIIPAITFTPTGIGTRVQVAAATGSAMLIAGTIAWAVLVLPRNVRRTAFPFVFATIVLVAFIRLQTIEKYWAEAPRLQMQVLEPARSDLRHIPAGSTVILDGVCPYHGPAIIFENGEVGSALSLVLDREVVGDAISERAVLMPTGIQTTIYGESALYPFARDLFIYDPTQGRVVALPDYRSAALYFARRTPPECPPGYVARGVEV